jgi:hypothetical protein
MATAPIVDRLPDPLLLLIGEAVTAWAVQEHELRLLVFLLLALDPKRGRLSVRNARAKEMVDLIADLMHLSEIQSKTTRLKAFADALEEIENRRNAVVHNIWLRVGDGPFYLQSLSGTWPSKTGEFKRKRRIDPAGIPIDVSNLEDLVRAIRQTTKQTRHLRQEVAGALAAKGATVVLPTE